MFEPSPQISWSAMDEEAQASVVRAAVVSALRTAIGTRPISGATTVNHKLSVDGDVAMTLLDALEAQLGEGSLQRFPFDRYFDDEYELMSPVALVIRIVRFLVGKRRPPKAPLTVDGLVDEVLICLRSPIASVADHSS